MLDLKGVQTKKTDSEIEIEHTFFLRVFRNIIIRLKKHKILSSFMILGCED